MGVPKPGTARISEDSADFHGCEIRLPLVKGKIHHETKNTLRIPTVRSYPDGVKVGCTFLTTDALETLYAWHLAFLLDKHSRTHQQGDYD